VTGTGETRSLDVIDDYRRRITDEIRLSRPIKAVVDCGNGVPGAIAPSVLAAAAPGQ